MRESTKAASIVLAAVVLLSSAIVMPSLAAIFNEGWKEDYGDYQDWAWAYLSAWYNIKTRTWYGIGHDHNWDSSGPYYYEYWGAEGNDPYDPFTESWVNVYVNGHWVIPDAYAYVQF